MKPFGQSMHMYITIISNFLLDLALYFKNKDRISSRHSNLLCIQTCPQCGCISYIEKEMNTNACPSLVYLITRIKDTVLGYYRC
jgi:hypothetical protein